jgi:hypothetical protein
MLAVAPVASIAVGVGIRPSFCIVGLYPLMISCASVPLSPLTGLAFPLLTLPSIFVGVFSNKPDPGSVVRCVDACSWQNNWDDFVAFIFQVKLDRVEYQPS